MYDGTFASRLDWHQPSPCLRLISWCDVVVKRKKVNDLWECSWDCGFKHERVGVVSWHETHDHCNKKPSAYDYTGEKFSLTWKKF